MIRHVTKMEMDLCKKINPILKNINTALITSNLADKSLMMGDMGSLLHNVFYQEIAIDSEMDEQHLLEKKLDQILSSLFDAPPPFNSICTGRVGILQGLNLLTDLGWIAEEALSPYLYEMDLIICESVMLDMRERNLDYLHGALGQIAYLFERLEKNNEIRFYLSQILDVLEKGASKTEQGIYWPSSFLEDTRDKQASIFGSAHGMTAHLFIFKKFIDSNIEVARAQDLLEQCLHYFMSCTVLQDDKYYLPYKIDLQANAVVNTYQIGWCFGMLNIQNCFLQILPHVTDRKLISQLENFIAQDFENPDEDGLTHRDACFCHGSAGIAYIYRNLFRLTGKSLYYERYRQWIQKTVDLEVTGTSIGGYTFMKDHVNSIWENDVSMLQGIGGVGLVLISFLLDVESQAIDPQPWDKYFLIN